MYIIYDRMTCQRQQPIMFPYPYLQSSPKMQAKAKAQLFCFWKFSLFSSLSYRGWRKTYFSKQKFGVLSQRHAHIILVPFWRVLKKTAGFWPYGWILGAVSFPHSPVNHRTRTDNVTAVAHRSVWKPPAFETMKTTLYVRQFWEKISPIDIFVIPTWYFLVCLKRATYSISTLLSRCFSAIMYFYIRLRYTWGLWPQDEWVHTTKDWILSLAARLGPLNVKDMILTHMQRQIHYPYTIWPFSSTPANA